MLYVTDIERGQEQTDVKVEVIMKIWAMFFQIKVLVMTFCREKKLKAGVMDLLYFYCSKS